VANVRLPQNIQKDRIYVTYEYIAVTMRCMMALTLSCAVVTICTAYFNINKDSTVCLQNVFVFRMVLTINSDCFPKQH
jgi:hypothetical protein